MKKKAVIIGIDGVPQGLLSDMVTQGAMGGLEAILKDGYGIHRMRASLPEISSVSWTSFMTGTNSGEHGVFGFTHLRPGSYDLTFPNSRDIKVPTFFQRLTRERQAERVVVLNVPNTYPAFPVEGLLVSGFVAIDFAKAVYPQSYIPMLQQMGYVIDVELQKVRQDKEGFYEDLVASLSARERVSLRLLEQEDWDLFITCITETDRLHHFFYDEAEEERFRGFYGLCDRFIESVYTAAREKLGDDFLFLILSDHGFAPLKTEVNLNAWLVAEGMLKQDWNREFYDKIAEGTVAFAMDPGRIYIHYADRYPRGHVKREEGRVKREELKALLFDLTAPDGHKVIRHVFEKEEIYHGPYVEDGPDLVCVPYRGYDLKGNMRHKEIFTKDIFTGMHTWDDAVLVAPETMEIDESVNIEYPAKLILDHFRRAVTRH